MKSSLTLGFKLGLLSFHDGFLYSAIFTIFSLSYYFSLCTFCQAFCLFSCVSCFFLITVSVFSFKKFFFLKDFKVSLKHLTLSNHFSLCQSVVVISCSLHLRRSFHLFFTPDLFLFRLSVSDQYPLGLHVNTMSLCLLLLSCFLVHYYKIQVNSISFLFKKQN